MFSNFESQNYEFSSNWKKNFRTQELETQTDIYKIVHRGINIRKLQSKECQTDSYLFVEEDIQAEADEADLLSFINKVSPNIINALVNNERSTAFTSYKNVNKEVYENICLHTIYNKTDDHLAVKNISQLSWNSTGSVLAASFGEITHSKWCVHTNTGVGIYSLSSMNKNQLEEKADTVLETTTCACSVSFHHTLPSLLAAGTHNGELIIWDRSRSDNDVLLATTTNNKIHKDSLNSLHWVKDLTKKVSSSIHQLISLSTDGTIVSWNLSMRKNIIIPINCYRLTARDLPKSIRYKGNMSKNLCILCGDLNPFDNEYIVTGTNSGSIFICRIENKEESTTLINSKEINSPVDSILASLSGAVHAIVWSNIIRNLIAAVSVDGLIHIYNADQREQILSIDSCQGYLYDLSLSSLLHGVVATSGENGTIVLSDILSQNIVPNEENSNLEENLDIVSHKIVLKVSVSDNNHSFSAMNCVVLNEKNFNQLAASDMNGTIYIWQIAQQNSEKGSHSRQVQLEEVLSCSSKG